MFEPRDVKQEFAEICRYFYEAQMCLSLIFGNYQALPLKKQFTN